MRHFDVVLDMLIKFIQASKKYGMLVGGTDPHQFDLRA
jgi:hypothetical protein